MDVINAFILTFVLSVMTVSLACLAGRETGKRLILSEKGGLKENPAFYNPVNAVINILKMIPYVLILFFLYLPLNERLNISLIIALAVFLELFPMFALAVRRALNKVPVSVKDAAVAMGSDPDEVMKYFVFPEAKDEIRQKTVRLFIYGILCALGTQAMVWVL